MKRVIIFCLILLLLATVTVLSTKKQKAERLPANSGTTTFVLNSEPVVTNDTYQNLLTTRFAVLPHHSLVNSQIAKFFNSIKNQPIERVIIVGPNHKDIGKAGILTTKASWQVGENTLSSDAGFVDTLLNNSWVQEEDTVFENEQSITTLVPFVSYYFPDAKLVPIIIKSTVSYEDSSKLGELIKQQPDENTLIIASVDFSHYLPYLQAEANDKYSEQLLLTKDTQGFFGLGSDYLDSPQSLAVLFSAITDPMEPSILFHGNSTELNPTTSNSTTSYFVVAY